MTCTLNYTPYLHKSEDKTPYRTTDEDKLLKYFRKIEDRSSKQTVIHVARLAAQKNWHMAGVLKNYTFSILI